MEELLKIGEKSNRLDQEVEMSEFEKKLHFAKQEIPEYSDGKFIFGNSRELLEFLQF